MNSICLTGRVTKNIEINDKKIGKLTVAVQRQYKNKEDQYETDFFNCVVFNANDYIKNNVLKGTQISIEGRLQNNNYEINGEKRYSTEIVVNRLEILNKINGNGNDPIGKEGKPGVDPFTEFSEEHKFDLPF